MQDHRITGLNLNPEKTKSGSVVTRLPCRCDRPPSEGWICHVLQGDVRRPKNMSWTRTCTIEDFWCSWWITTVPLCIPGRLNYDMACPSFHLTYFTGERRLQKPFLMYLLVPTTRSEGPQKSRARPSTDQLIN